MRDARPNLLLFNILVLDSLYKLGDELFDTRMRYEKVRYLTLLLFFIQMAIMFER